jgi:hypothetical protein
VNGAENFPGKSSENRENAEAKGKVLGSQESGHGLAAIGA